MRFLLTRRWVLFALAVALLAVVCVRLGEWQFDRMHQREQLNEWTRTNLAAEPVPVEDVLSVGGEVEPDQEWMRVTARGSYDGDATVVIRYQTHDGASGVDLVTPLVTPDGTAVLVERGWLETSNTGDMPDDLPAPPHGEVEVVGFVRPDAGSDVSEVRDGSARAVSSEAIGATVEYPVVGGYMSAESETPPPVQPVVRAEPPDLVGGPHLFYGIQWWFFGALALFGFGYLAWDERRGRNRPATAGHGAGRPVNHT